MPEPRWFHEAGEGSDRRIYVFGGFVRGPAGQREYGVGEFSLVYFDPISNRWLRGPAVPPAYHRQRDRVRRRRIGSNGEINDEWIWKDRENPNRVSHDVPTGRTDPFGRILWYDTSVWVDFNPATGQWEQSKAPVRVDNPDYRPGSTLPQSVWEHTGPNWYRNTPSTATSPEGLVFITGGLARPLGEPLAEARVHESVEVYDAKTSEWRELAPMHHARYLHAAAVDRKGRLFVFGGSSFGTGIERGKDESDASWEARGREMDRQASTSIASVEMYDPKTNTWTERAPLPTPRQAMGADVGADGRIYVVGGAPSYAHPAPMDVVEIYDPETDRWEKGPSLYYPRRGHAVVATEDGKLYAIGGYVGPHRRSLGDVVSGQKIDPNLGATVEMLDTRELAKGL